ncbi:MAG TPA: hypothetical protein VMU34_08340 [Mycobacterium sp.]|nr:hypothetical protein [Mycobacterium sp.]
MVETFVAAGDLVTAIPSMWNDLRVPLAIVAIFIGGGVAVMKLHHGVGKAIGVAIGAAVLAAVILGSSGLVETAKQTIDRHGGISVGQFGR